LTSENSIDKWPRVSHHYDRQSVLDSAITHSYRRLTDMAIESPQAFIALLSGFDYRPQLRAEHGGQPPLFSAPSKAMQPR
jgi:hypothetical protein